MDRQLGRQTEGLQQAWRMLPTERLFQAAPQKSFQDSKGLASSNPCSDYEKQDNAGRCSEVGLAVTPPCTQHLKTQPPPAQGLAGRQMPAREEMRWGNAGVPPLPRAGAEQVKPGEPTRTALTTRK